MFALMVVFLVLLAVSIGYVLRRTMRIGTAPAPDLRRAGSPDDANRQAATESAVNNSAWMRGLNN